jgi:hypothetical protein
MRVSQNIDRQVEGSPFHVLDRPARRDKRATVEGGRRRVGRICETFNLTELDNDRHFDRASGSALRIAASTYKSGGSAIAAFGILSDT